MLEGNNFNRDSQRNCWNCRLYDDCERKYYITDVCEKYVSCIKNTKRINKFECTDDDIVNLDD